MNTNVPQNTEDQEIDLTQIPKKISNFFDRINTLIFKVIQFFIKNAVTILILFALGFGIGMYLDQTKKSYSSEVIVTPNFGSIDYLYSKVNLIQSKIREGDTVFLKKVVGIKNPKKFKNISIEPINDVYKFIEEKEQNFDLLKLMAEDGDLKKIISENTTSKNYPFHRIQFVTTGLTSKDLTEQPILDYLNNSDFYKKVQKEGVNTIKLKLAANEIVIKQIDGVLNSFSNATNSSQRNDKLVYYNENTQLNDVIKTKNDLVNEQGFYRLELVKRDKIVKDNSSTLNIKDTTGINGKKYLLIPFLFVLSYILIGYFKSFYKKQLAQAGSN